MTSKQGESDKKDPNTMLSALILSEGYVLTANHIVQQSIIVIQF